jgi:DHA2 family multidrug resistance protein
MTAGELSVEAGAGVQRTLGVDNKWLVTLSVGFGAIMATIDASIVNVAIPHIRGAVGATIEEITWITTGYIVAAVLVMPLTGFLGSMFGQKRVYLAGLALFVAGSALCGMARSLTALVIFRAIQGIGGGTLQPTQQAIMRQTFPLREQGMAMAMFAVVIMVGPAVGPTLGGWITDNFSWPWIFYINLPIGLLGILMVLRFVHEPEDVRAANRVRAEAQRRSMDWAGIALMIVGVAALQYTLEEGPSKDWFESSTIITSALIAAAGLAAFVVRELTAPVPVVNLRLFRDRTFLVATVISGVQFAILMASMFLLPLFTQELLGFSAMQSGLLLLPRSIVMIAAMPFIGRMYNHVPPALMVAVGILLLSLGSYDLSRMTLDTSSAGFFLPLILTGVGFSCLIVPLTTAALSRIPRPLLADASGLNSFVRQVGGSTGLAIFATLLERYGVQARAALSAHVSALRPEAVERLAALKAMFLGRGIDPATSGMLAIKVLSGKVAVQGMVIAFEKAFFLQAAVFLAVLPLLYFLRVPRIDSGPAGRAMTE